MNRPLVCRCSQFVFRSRMSYATGAAIWAWLTACLLFASEPDERSSLRIAPLEPTEAIKSFRVQGGFEMQLIAAEPLVSDPVAIEYDEDGRAYVAEMRDYPYTDPTTDQPFTDRTTDLPLGRIRLLLDKNGDGAFDHSTIFAEDLSWPSSIAVSRGGLFVAATPDVWYFKDTDGDGRADQRQRVLSGFRKFNVQALINNLKWGIDHRLYGAGSSNGGQIVVGENDSADPIPFSTQDFRIDPPHGLFEALQGGGRFGNAFDDWGERFICNIRNPIRHIVVPDYWALAQPSAPVPAFVHDVAISGDTIPVYRISPPEPWRVINSQRLAQAIEQTSPRSESVAAGYMTSACGLTFYRGSAYPPEYYGQAFLGEVAGNLIHRQQLVRQGTTFRSERIDERCEFVASTDNWFRPVNFVNAPDGTLHVVDMYRETIEHPWSIPDDIKAQLDLQSGRDRGRIYRLAPIGFQPPAIPKLSEATTVELVSLLAHGDAWRRDTAHRLLFERQDLAAVPALRELLKAGESPPPRGRQPDFSAVARVLALWSLEGLAALSRDDVELALSDPAPQVRKHAIRLAASHQYMEMRELLTLADDSDPSVRAEAAWALSMQEDASLEVLLKLCQHDTQDPWLRAAIVVAAKNVEARLLEKLIPANELLSDAQRDVLLLKQLAIRVGQRTNAPEITSVLTAARSCSQPATVFAVLSGCAHGLNTSTSPKTLYELLDTSDLRHWLDDRFAEAREQAIDDEAEIAQRVESVELLRHADFDSAAPIVKQLLSATQPTALQVAAVRTLASSSHPSISEVLLENYQKLGPEAQQQATEALSRSDRVPQLLDALERDQINFAALPLAQRGVLLRSSNPDWKARVVELAKKQQTTPRAKVVQDYAAALPMLTTDIGRGTAIFRRVCSSCHRLAQEGADLGPPLETVQHRSVDELLIAILDPSREVLPEYLEYAAVLKDGTTTTGIIAAESAAAISLKRAGAIEQTIQRRDIDEIFAAGKSIMPEGLERELSHQDLADLIAFLRHASTR